MNTLLYKKYISHTLFLKGLMVLWCVRDEWRQGLTAILTQLLLLTIACCVIFKNPLSTSSASWLGLLNQGSLRATALSLQAGPHSGLPVSNWLNSHWHLPILFHNTHLLLLLLPLIYTSASLVDGSVKGQYITLAFAKQNCARAAPSIVIWPIPIKSILVCKPENSFQG